MAFAIGEAQLQRRLDLERQLEQDTDELAQLQDSLEKTNGLTEKMVAMIVEYLDLPNKEEVYITKGPKDGDFAPYLAVVGKMKEALSYLTATKYKASEVTIVQLVTLIPSSHAYGFLGTPPPSIPKDKLDELSVIAAELGSLDMAPGSKGDLREHVKIFSEDFKKTQGYQRGVSMFPAYVKSCLSMMKVEKELIGKLIIKPQALACFGLTIKESVELLLETGESLIMRGKRMGHKKDSNDIYMLIDISETLTVVVKEFEGIIAYSQDKGLEISDMIGNVKGVPAQFFKEILDELQADSQKSALPADGTVHEITSVTLNVIKRLLEYHSAVDIILSYARTTTITLPSPNFQILITDFLENLLTSLDARSKGYKKAKMCRLDEVVKTDILSRFETTWSKQKDLYRDTWKPCFDYLMDTIYVQAGGVKALTKAQKDGVKDRFKNFNSELESMLAIQKTYTIPDVELKALVMKDLKSEKYIKYDKDGLEKLLDQFFEGSI
ncbi:Cullin repeat-like-containing domain protein [Chytridium lagenaria]|nr:Cullin repeat-like-containing domain protein [Chytridium lagenaria]